jgi:transcriptional regulator with PAS, ATPase and Fis domain
LQESEVTRVGELESRTIDVRVIAATNRDLEQAISDGRFREDLYYRLSVFPIHLPPLRERSEDVPLLAEHFLEELTRRSGRECPGITPEALSALCTYEWPGNVRELWNEIQRALVLSDPGEPIDLNVLSEKVSRKETGDPGGAARGTLRHAVEAVERDLIERAAVTFGGNKTRMAEHLGISRWTLLQKMRAFGLEAVREDETS